MLVGELIAQLQQMPADRLVGIDPGDGHPIIAVAGAAIASLEINSETDFDEYDPDVFVEATLEIVVIRPKQAAANDA